MRRQTCGKVRADTTVSALRDVLVGFLGKGETIKITGLLSVERVACQARMGRNPAPANKSRSRRLQRQDLRWFPSEEGCCQVNSHLNNFKKGGELEVAAFLLLAPSGHGGGGGIGK